MTYPAKVIRLALERARELVAENPHESPLAALYKVTQQIEQDDANASQLYAESKLFLDHAEKVRSLDDAVARLGGLRLPIPEPKGER